MTRQTRQRALRGLVLSSLLAVPAAASAGGGGMVTGKVEATPARYLEETVVYLKEVPGPHPKQTATLDQKGMKFIPHVLAITAGDTVKFANSDNVDHNVFTPDGEGYNLGTFKAGENRPRAFDKPGVYQQLCSVHPEMLAFIFVGQNPYHAVVDAKGGYKIEHVPPGTYQLAIWNSHLKAAEQSVTVSTGKPVEANFSLKR